jgi:hypothetical protein
VLGERLSGEERLVPAAAGDPGAGRLRGGALGDALHQLLEAPAVLEVDVLESLAETLEVAVRVDEPGTAVPPARSMRRGSSTKRKPFARSTSFAACASISSFVPSASTRPSSIRSASTGSAVAVGRIVPPLTIA